MAWKLKWKSPKKQSLEEIEALMQRLVGNDHRPTEWELFRYHGYSRSAPTWSEFADGEGFVAAIGFLCVRGRGYWAVVYPRRSMSHDPMMYIFDLRGAIGQPMKLELWEEDPRALPQSLSAYASGHPALPAHHNIKSSADFAALRSSV